jgi:hypothetical protein
MQDTLLRREGGREASKRGCAPAVERKVREYHEIAQGMIGTRVGKRERKVVVLGILQSWEGGS